MMTPVVLAAVLATVLATGLLGLSLAEAERESSPIRFEREFYSWTEKIRIMIVAPSWNEERHAIDSIGGDDEHFVKVSTRRHDLKPYRLVETGPNSGIFAGEVTLTGFRHDVDGDGDSDTAPRTAGSGPTNGVLEADSNDALTVSFSFRDGEVISRTVPIGWSTGTVEFLGEGYDADGQVRLRVIDRDMNLNPESADHVRVNVFSDSDRAGILLEAVETSEDSGVFEGTVQLTRSGKSGGDRLRAVPPEAITASYEDRTLPPPYDRSDSLEMTDLALFDSDVGALDRVSLAGISISDGLGNSVPAPSAGTQLQIVGRVANMQDYDQEFVLIAQVAREDGTVDHISWIRGELGPMQTLDVSQSWTPAASGSYGLEIFAWESIANPAPLSRPHLETLFVSA